MFALLFVGLRCYRLSPLTSCEERPNALMLLGQNHAGTTPEDSGYKTVS